MTTEATTRTGRWELLPTQTRAGFTVRNLGVTTVNGQIPVTAGWVDVDATGQPTAVHADLALARIDTGSRRRDRDLSKPHLLDTNHYPSLAFDGVVTGSMVDGQLVGRKTVRLSLGLGAVTTVDEGLVTVRATAIFDRRALGVRAPRFLIGRRIAVTIDAVFAPPGQPAPR